MLQGQRVEIAVDQKRLARVDDFKPKTVRRPGRYDTPVAFFVRVGHGDQVSNGIEGGDIDDVHFEDFLDLLSDQLIDRVDVQLRGKRLLDVVDHQQFRKMLLYLLLQHHVLLFQQSVGVGEFCLRGSLAADHALLETVEEHEQHHYGAQDAKGIGELGEPIGHQKGVAITAPGTGSAHRCRP